MAIFYRAGGSGHDPCIPLDLLLCEIQQELLCCEIITPKTVHTVRVSRVEMRIVTGREEGYPPGRRSEGLPAPEVPSRAQNTTPVTFTVSPHSSAASSWNAESMVGLEPVLLVLGRLRATPVHVHVLRHDGAVHVTVTVDGVLSDLDEGVEGEGQGAGVNQEI